MATVYYRCASCGESIKIRTTKNSRDADRYAKWLESQGRKCDACFAAEATAANQAAAENPLNARLPELEGSDKQIAWATAVRLEVLPRITEALEAAVRNISLRCQSAGLSAAALGEMTDAACLIAQELRDEVRASEWIERRAWHVESIAHQVQVGVSKRSAILCPTATVELAARKTGGGHER